jgi:nucleoside-diphosphate-sugar epimerase
VITVLGASGFIGSHLVARLRATGVPFWAPTRDDLLGGALWSRPLGSVLYCIGVTADFRHRPLATVDAHVTTLAEILRGAEFDRLVYLSSSRVYRRSPGPCRESDPLPLRPDEPDDLYGLSKALGEAVVLSREDTAVARLSNVYGPSRGQPTFLSAVLAAAVDAGAVVLEQALDSAKDYVGIGDVVALLLRIAEHGRERVYNVASGVNVTHGDIVEVLRNLTGCAVRVEPDAPTVRFPPISIDRIAHEFGFVPTPLLEALPGLVEQSRLAPRVGG